MRILFHYESMALGGQQTHLYNLLRELPPRCEVHLAYNNPGDFLDVMATAAPCHALGVPLRHREYQRRPWRVAQAAWRLDGVVRRIGAGALVTGSGVGSIWGGLVARARRIPHARVVGGAPSQIEARLYANYKRLCVDRLIDRYFGWEAVFQELEAVGVSRSKMTETPPAVDGSLFRPPTPEERREARRALGLPDDVMVIGWSGRIAENMQVKWTVAMAAELARRGRVPVHLLLVGGGDWVEELTRRVADAGLSDRTTFLGWRPYLEMPRLYGAMDVVPLLSEDPQGGSILREAMACGRAVMTVDGPSGAQREFVRHLENGILFGVTEFTTVAADWAERLWDDRELSAALGDGAAAYAHAEMSFARVAGIVADWAEGAAGRP